MQISPFNRSSPGRAPKRTSDLLPCSCETPPEAEEEVLLLGASGDTLLRREPQGVKGVRWDARRVRLGLLGLSLVGPQAAQKEENDPVDQSALTLACIGQHVSLKFGNHNDLDLSTTAAANNSAELATQKTCKCKQRIRPEKQEVHELVAARTLLAAPGLTTRNKDPTRRKGHRY